MNSLDRRLAELPNPFKKAEATKGFFFSLMHEGSSEGDRMEFDRITDILTIYRTVNRSPGHPRTRDQVIKKKSPDSRYVAPPLEEAAQPTTRHPINLKGPCSRIAHLYGALTTHNEGWTLVDLDMTRPAGVHWLSCMEAAMCLIRPEQLKVPNESERTAATSRLGPRWASELMDSLRDLAKKTSSSLKFTHKGTITWQHLGDKDADRLELNKDTNSLRICFNDLSHMAAEGEPRGEATFPSASRR